MIRRTGAALAGAALLLAGCGNDDGEPAEPAVLLDLPAAQPGEIVGLVANDEDRTIEWVDRLDGTIRSLAVDGDTDADDVVTIASVPVATEGEQRGLLGQVVIDGRRFASWTQPDSLDLVVGEIVDGAPTNIVWNAGESGAGAIGGVLDELDGRIVLGLGRNTGWDRETGAGGGILLLDPDGEQSQEPAVVSVGYTNPWAFTVVDDSEVWVADNAAGPDPQDDSVDDVERIGRADLLPDRADMTRVGDAGRAPSAMDALPDGRLGICGFLDNELRAYEIVDGADADPSNPATADLDRSEAARAGTIMPCLTGVAIFADGTIVTAALGDIGTRLVILAP